MVPRAKFRSYYGRPILKEPTWKVPDVPAYLTLGGLAGASAVTAVAAEVTGRRGLARVGRLAAAVGSAGGAAALVHDLGRPERFLNMLRVVKPTSPLSVGSWILAPFATMAGAAAASELTGLLPRLGRTAGMGAAVLGPAMTTYTAVLFADTAIPAWHEAYPELPFVFAGSAMASAAGVALAAAPLAETGPPRRLAVLGAGVELAASHRIESRLGLVGEPYRQPGRAHSLLLAGKVLTTAGVGLAVLGRRSRAVSVLAGASLVSASYLTRFGIFEAGRESARDPRYTVVPQRERLDARVTG
jgi:hypothetical protein